MKQISYAIHSKLRIVQAIENFKSFKECKTAKSIFARIYINYRDTEIIDDILTALRRELPNVEIMGSTGDDVILDGTRQKITAMITFQIFESSTVEVISCDYEQNDETLMAQYITDNINNAEDAIGVQFVCDTQKCNASIVLNQIDVADENIAFFGMVLGTGTGIAVVEPEYAHKIFAFDKEGNKKSVIAAIYRGSDLHIRTELASGWTPVGRQMKVTKVQEDNVVCEVEHEPIMYMYWKYLRTKPDEYFIRNISEFPLIISREGIDIARGAAKLTPNGGVWYPSGIKNNDMIRLSFGNIRNMLAQTQKKAWKIVNFQPQAINIFVGISRSLYLNEYADEEIEYYTRVCHCVSGSASSFGQIWRNGRRADIFDGCLIAVAIREGEEDLSMHIVESFEGHQEKGGVIPITERLYTLLDAATTEFVKLQEHEREVELEREISFQKAANEAKSEFLANMSHEIRTPINAVLGMNEMIMRECEDDNIRDYSYNIRNAGNALLGLVNDILDFSKIEAGKMDLVLADYQLSALLNDLYMMIEEKTKEKQLALIFDIDENIPDMLFGDESRLRQVLLNILNNAVKYTRQGSVKFIVEGDEIAGENINITFHVIDTGIGIKPEDQSKIYDPFERVDEGANRSIEGTGLGMSITTNILKLMNSSLMLDSVYGQGSDFYFTITQKVIKNIPIGDFEENMKKRNVERRDYKEMFQAPSASVLVVDDTLVNIIVIENLLKKTQMKVERALSGQEALDLAEQNKYDIILMDHRMPKMDGSEAMHHIKSDEKYKLNKDTPIVVLTANAVVGMREKFLREGFDDYLSKPVEPAKLEMMLSAYLPQYKVKRFNIRGK